MQLTAPSSAVLDSRLLCGFEPVGIAAELDAHNIILGGAMAMLARPRLRSIGIAGGRQLVVLPGPGQQDPAQAEPDGNLFGC